MYPVAKIAAFLVNPPMWLVIAAAIGEGEWTLEQWDQYADVVYQEIFSKVKF
jgi:hypothetical protein